MNLKSIESMEKVTTYDGTKAPRSDCRFIKGEYYIKGEQCFLIDDQWYRINSPKIAYDHTTKEYVIKTSPNLVFGVVELSKTGDITEGYFSVSRDYIRTMDTTPMLYKNGSYKHLLYGAILNKCSLVREGLNGHYYIDGDPDIPREMFVKLKPNKEGYYPIPFTYGSECHIDVFKSMFAPDYEPLFSTAYRYINDYTFGVEFETERGAVPFKHLSTNGLIPCRDGSIAGFEYATIPLNGAVGIQVIKKACDLLTKYCSCSPNESLHIHVGGYPRTVRHLAALYRLCLKIQDEVYSMFPYYYINTSKFKKKSYCNPLEPLGTEVDTPMEIFKLMFLFLSGGAEFKKFPTGPHPLDRSGQHKWEVSPRYVWCNMIPLIWGGRGTVEFRCHTPTLNAQKVINWLFIVVSILKYARKHYHELSNNRFDDISPVSLTDILTEAYPRRIYDVLLKYISERKYHYAKKNDPIGEVEIYNEMEGKNEFTLMPFV